MDVLDPWDDAAEIAKRLHRPGSTLVVLIGAEAWCEKCRNLRPHFEHLRSQLSAHVVALWMDLEDHSEFLGDYIPESLPEICIYQRGMLVSKQSLDGTEQSLRHALSAVPEQNLPVGNDPGVFERLTQQDWAHSSKP